MIRSYTRVAAMLVALACHQAIGGPNRYIEIPPNADELVGAWRPTESSLERLAKFSFERLAEVPYGRTVNDHLIELFPDHSCRYHSYPDYDLGDAPLIISSHCTWQLSTKTAFVRHDRRDVPALELEIREGDDAAVAAFYITRENGRIVLWQFIGDPDYWDYIDFIRQ